MKAVSVVRSTAWRRSLHCALGGLVAVVSTWTIGVSLRVVLPSTEYDANAYYTLSDAVAAVPMVSPVEPFAPPPPRLTLVVSDTPSTVTLTTWTNEGVIESETPVANEAKPEFDFSVAPQWRDALVVKQRAAQWWQHTLTQSPPPPPRAPLQLMRMVQQQTAVRNESTTIPRIMAIVTSTVSQGRQQDNVTSSTLVLHLLASLASTITPAERDQWHIHVYVAIDDVDTWWLEHWSELARLHVVQDTHATHGTTLLDWWNITVGVFAQTRPGDLPFNEMALVAYQDGAEYFCRVNDDSVFVSSGWLTAAVTALRAHQPIPNVGVVAPTCDKGNGAIMTHDFVHRTHLDIFGHYYPTMFDNWFLDDWMSNVYTRHVLGWEWNISRSLSHWRVEHGGLQRRYEAQFLQGQWLPYVYRDSRHRMVQYLTTHHPQLATSLPNNAWPMPRRMPSSTVQTILDTIPPRGNLLVWGFDDDSPFWHLATTGLVVFLDGGHAKDLAMQRDQSFPYLQIEHVSYHTLPDDQAANFQRYVMDQHESNQHWCELELVLPESVWRTRWDVILVSSPPACYNWHDTCPDTHGASGPGIFQPLYMSQRLASRHAELLGWSMARNNRTADHHTTHVFVTNFERATERDLSRVVFESKPHAVLTDPTGHRTWGHYRIDDHHVIRRNTTWCGPPMHTFRTAPDLVPWRYPTARMVAASSIVQSPDTWTILLEVNHGYYDFLLNWLAHFVPLNIAIPVVIMAMDDVVYAQLQRDVIPRYNVTVERSRRTVDSSVLTTGLNDLVSMRATHILALLERGRHVVYTDVDTVWRRSPLPYLAAVTTTVDVAAAMHNPHHSSHYHPYYSTGFMAVACHPRTVALVTKWQDKIAFARERNTDWFNFILNKLGARHQPLPLLEFPDGETYAQFVGDQGDATVVVHPEGNGTVPQKQLVLQRQGLWKIP